MKRDKSANLYSKCKKTINDDKVNSSESELTQIQTLQIQYKQLKTPHFLEQLGTTESKQSKIRIESQFNNKNKLSFTKINQKNIKKKLNKSNILENQNLNDVDECSYFNSDSESANENFQLMKFQLSTKLNQKQISDQKTEHLELQEEDYLLEEKCQQISSQLLNPNHKSMQKLNTQFMPIQPKPTINQLQIHKLQMNKIEALIPHIDAIDSSQSPFDEELNLEQSLENVSIEESYALSKRKELNDRIFDQKLKVSYGEENVNQEEISTKNQIKQFNKNMALNISVKNPFQIN